MRANSVLLLIALVGSTGCASGYAGGDYGYEHPVYGSSYDHGDYRHVYNTGLGVYTVVGYPSVYFHDGWYWRYSGSHWQRCARPYGGTWSHIAPHYVPRKLHAHYDRGHYRADPRRDQRHEHKTLRRDHPNERRQVRDDHRYQGKQVRGDDRYQGKQVRGDDRYQGKQVRGDDRFQGKQVRGDHRNQATRVRPERQDPGRQPIRAQRPEPRLDRNERAVATRSRDDHSDARGQQRPDRSELKKAGRPSPQELRREPRKPHERARRERATARHEQRSEERGQRQRAESQPQERHGRLAGTDWRGNRY